MDKYKDYVARMQNERIALDTLATLDDIKALLTALTTPKSITPEVVPEVKSPEPEVVEKPKRTTRAAKGDK